MASHESIMRRALQEAQKSTPKSTNFCVGALLRSENEVDKLSVTGYTLECPGNTHAEQCCFIKAAEQYACDVEFLGHHLPTRTVLYTTMEPCNKRSVGNTPCVDRILALRRADGTPAISRVYIGVKEPETFVGINEGRKKLEAAGIDVIHVPGLEETIIQTATAGHPK